MVFMANNVVWAKSIWAGQLNLRKYFLEAAMMSTYNILLILSDNVKILFLCFDWGSEKTHDQLGDRAIQTQVSLTNTKCSYSITENTGKPGWNSLLIYFDSIYLLFLYIYVYIYI